MAKSFLSASMPLVPLANLTTKRITYDPAVKTLMSYTMMLTQISKRLAEKKTLFVDVDFILLASELSNQPPRIHKTIYEMIDEYKKANPEMIKMMGRQNPIPYQGQYDKETVTTSFNLINMPDSLVVMLNEFVAITKEHQGPSALSNTPHPHTGHLNGAALVVPSIDQGPVINGPTVEAKTTVFTLKECNPSLMQVKTTGMGYGAPVETPMLKNKFELLNPGKVSHTTSSGGRCRVMTRGDVTVVDSVGNPYETECTKMCWWHRHFIAGKAMGIPLKFMTTNGTKIIYMDGYFCSYGCVLARIEEEMEKFVHKRKFDATNARLLLFMLFDEEFPNEQLRAADDWEFLKDVGNGTMTEKEWKTGLSGIRIRKNPNFVYMPTGVSYDVNNA